MVVGLRTNECERGVGSIILVLGRENGEAKIDLLTCDHE